MVEKHEFLTEKADNLNAYMVGRDGMKENFQYIVIAEWISKFQIQTS